MDKEKRMTIWKKLWQKIKNICVHLFTHNKKTCKVCNYKELKKTPLGRVKIEYFELAEKNTKLREFIGSEIYNALSEEAKDLLKKQYTVQLEYLDILDKRIDIWSNK